MDQHLDEELLAIARRQVGQFVLARPDLTAGSVAAALRTARGTIYTGICIDAACGIGFCAEHAAVAAMLLARETVVRVIVAVSADSILPPCGRCRELLWQLDPANAHCMVLLPGGRRLPLGDLLPMPWFNV